MEVFWVSHWESFALFSTDNRFEISVSISLLLQNLPLLIDRRSDLIDDLNLILGEKSLSDQESSDLTKWIQSTIGKEKVTAVKVSDKVSQLTKGQARI